MNAWGAISDFIDFMEANGVKPMEPIAQRLASGQLIRFRCDGDNKGRQNGWAILYLDEHPAGAFGNYKANTGTLKWKASAEQPALTTAERTALRADWERARQRREAERASNEQQTAFDAAAIWKRSVPASPDHPYVQRKYLDAKQLRQDREMLVIPMSDGHGKLWNLQRIQPDGEKRFLRGGRTKDLFCIIGQIDTPTRKACIVEGYATGDAVRQSVGIPVIVAFSAANLVRVARLWNQHRPDIEYTIFGDDDKATQAKTGKNPGRDAAMAAAAEIGARVAFPKERVA